MIRFAWMWDSRRVGDFASGAVVSLTLLDGDRYVGGEVAQAPKEVITYVEPAVEEVELLIRRKRVKEAGRFGAMDGRLERTFAAERGLGEFSAALRRDDRPS